MPATFVKLFNSILHSTIWIEDGDTRLVWITMLAMSDGDGIIRASIPGLAHAARVPESAARIAVVKFLEPDLDSRSREYEGRRIVEVDGGWRLLNHGKYRAMLSADERREYNRKKQAEWREKHAKKPSKSVKKSQLHVNDSQSLSAMSAHSDSDSDSDSGNRNTKRNTASCAEPQTAAASTQNIEDEIISAFPIVGSEETWPLMKSKLMEWQITFVGLIVLEECAKARQWLLDNPKRRKTKRGMLRFLNGWLERGQNKRGGFQRNGTHNTAENPTRVRSAGYGDEIQAILDEKQKAESANIPT